MADGRDAIEAVRSRIEIVDLIQQYVQLKRTGKNWKALCPFHDEKTPSFIVNADRQTFHCFGCGEKGSAFDFVMRAERVEFREALEILAEKAGVTLETFRGGDDRDGRPEGPSKRQRALSVSDWAQKLFRRVWASPEGQVARDYVAGRGITEETAEAFGIGCAPRGWSTLVGRALEQGFEEATLEDAGLALRSAKRPGLYDRFRERLTFPIRDGQGRVIAFGARSLDGSEPKYLNSPETPLFSKGRTLFGIDLLRGHRREDPVLVMEGYTDVVMSWQAGFRGAVATLGTALTPEHARILRRYTDRVVLVYDGDSAGLTAAERGAQLLLEGGHLDLMVVVLPSGQDPCDWFVERGAAGVGPLLDRAVELLEFLLARTEARHDLGTLDGRRRAAEDLLGAAAAMTDQVARELVIERIAERVRVPRHALLARLAERRQQGRRRVEAAESGPAEGGETGRPSLKARAERDLVQAYLNRPELLASHPPEQLSEILSERVMGVLERLTELQEKGITAPGALLDHLEDARDRDGLKRLLLAEDEVLDLVGQLEGARRRLENLRNDAAIRARKDRADPEDLAEIVRLMRARKGRASGQGA